MNHRYDIDGLRAIAVLPVLLFHFKVGVFPGGFSGVDVFFVISGFVIASRISADIQAKQFTIRDFYIKRIRRLFPALAMTIAITSLLATIILLPTDLVGYGRSLMATALFVSNIYFWRASGYFASEALTQPLLHTWSLSVEEQFYIFAPIAFALIHTYGRQYWLRWLVPVIAASFAVCVAAVFLAPTAGFFLLPARAWELLIGSLIAFRGRPLTVGRWVRELGGLAGLGLVLFGMVALREDSPFPGWNALFPCLGTALIIMVGVGRGTDLPVANRLLACRPLVLIGLISYSLYLVHWPLAVFIRYETLRDPSWAEAGAMLAASIAIAWASWRFVEQPFRTIRITRRVYVFSLAAVTTVLMISLGEVGVAGNGFPGRFPGFTEQRISGVDDWGGTACFNLDPNRATAWNATDCTRIHGRHGRILLWGDSFAAQYIPGVLADAQRIDADVLQYTFAGCPPILAYESLGRVACAGFNQAALDLIKQQHIDTVVLAARWSEMPSRIVGQLNETIAKLKELGVRIFVIGQSPEFLTNVQRIDFISGNRENEKLAAWSVSFDPTLNVRLSQQASAATFIDPMPYLCDGSRCVYRDNSVYYYADYGHFSSEGSLRAVRLYFPAGVAPQPH